MAASSEKTYKNRQNSGKNRILRG